MAREWDVTLGMDFMRSNVAPREDAASPATYLCSFPSADTVGINDVLDFSGRGLFSSAFSSGAASAAAATDVPFLTSSNQTSADKPFSGETNSLSNFQCNQSYFGFDIPCEEEAELEWLSQFVEDSFSAVPYQYAGVTTPSSDNQQLRVDEYTTGRAARSKRSRCSNPSTVWSTLTPPPQLSPSSSSSSSDLPPSQPSPTVTITNISSKGSSRTKKGGGELGADGGVRRCTHCASEKTPQWRTGPLGPKTLCNACGVRYKSGRLLPEYRPAASPTFVLTQHSNSHRKVMELRRQREVVFRGHETKAAATGSEQLLLDGKGVC
ncbi:GATA transcription factor 4-like [Canna indica]|uniref:GATA transcription factor n=1 Tax=Canna indica TaxID=4628 RepID=A0AAQ3Q8D1_9LILI|nr:GATA transcription factor 4-like [Canna indica]